MFGFSGNVLCSSYTVLLGTMHRMKYLSCDSYVSVGACPTPWPLPKACNRMLLCVQVGTYILQFCV